MMTVAVALEPLQIACLLRIIGHQLGEIDQDLNASEITETTNELLNDYRGQLCAICDALTAECSPD
jgi:hypothetical protein